MTQPDDEQLEDRRLQELARLYAAGAVTWREIADELDDVSFGDLLLELARQGLALPTAEAPKTPGQKAMWDAALRRAAAAKKEEGDGEPDNPLEDAPWWWRTANGLALWARYAREQQGLSIPMLAARTGMAPRTLEAIERGRVWHVHVGVLIRVADALGYRLDLARRDEAAKPDWPTQKAVADVFHEDPTEWDKDHAVLKAWLAKNRGRADVARPLTVDDLQRIKALVGGVEVDLDAPLSADETVVKTLFDQGELERVDLDAWPLLRGLARSRHRWIPGAEALALYERNWRNVEESRPSAGERALIEALASRYGVNGKLHIKPSADQQNDDEKLEGTKDDRLAIAAATRFGLGTPETWETDRAALEAWLAKNRGGWRGVERAVAAAVRHCTGAVRLFRAGPLGEDDGYVHEMALLHAFQLGYVALEDALLLTMKMVGEEPPPEGSVLAYAVTRMRERPPILDGRLFLAADRLQRFAASPGLHRPADIDDGEIASAEIVAAELPGAFARFRAALEHEREEKKEDGE